ncbi:MAG TPA: response regulator transcription factor [Candidatus Angelobacter sp.]
MSRNSNYHSQQRRWTEAADANFHPALDSIPAHKNGHTQTEHLEKPLTHMLSILLVDDFAVVRRGLRALLEGQRGWNVVAEATTGSEAVELATELRPDVAILDINIPELNGLDAARLILKSAPDTKVLILSAYHTEEMIDKALRAGVRGYVLKSDAEAELVAAVKALMEGRTFFTQVVSEVMVEHLRHEKEKSSHPMLTVREGQVVQLLAQGKSNKEVGSILGISPRTAENHRAQIMTKLGLRSFSELVRYAIRNGMVEP